MIDFVGDIHGHREKLEALLQILGYERIQGTYRHPDRKIIFFG
jgi:hypothetical protein